MARARSAILAHGYKVVAIDALGHGHRPRTPADEQAREDMCAAVMSGDKARFESVSVGYAISLAERVVPEWQATLDALQRLPEIGLDAPVGYGDGISLGTAIGIPLTAAEPRITAAIFCAGFFAYDELIAARRAVPVQFLLLWDDEYVSRESGPALFDAFASEEKTLHANPGDHRTTRWVGVDEDLLARHLRPAVASPG